MSRKERRLLAAKRFEWSTKSKINQFLLAHTNVQLKSICSFFYVGLKNISNCNNFVLRNRRWNWTKNSSWSRITETYLLALGFISNEVWIIFDCLLSLLLLLFFSILFRALFVCVTNNTIDDDKYTDSLKSVETRNKRIDKVRTNLLRLHCRFPFI